MSFKANTKAVEQTVTAEMNPGNKSQTKQNPFLLLAVEKCIDPPPKSIETPSGCFLLYKMEERLVNEVHSLSCADMFVKLQCKMGP